MSRDGMSKDGRKMLPNVHTCNTESRCNLAKALLYLQFFYFLIFKYMYPLTTGSNINLKKISFFTNFAGI